MSEFDELPEAYIAEGNRRVMAPAYEALMPCQIIMTSGETGATGPTRIEAGEHFITESTPNHYWAPLNRAAGERIQAWLAALPTSGQGLSQEEISEAAYAMRPREGEKEIPHEQWWPAVLKYAAAMKEKRRGSQLSIPRPAAAVRPGRAIPVMPYASSGPVTPMEIGRAPAQTGNEPAPPANAARRAVPTKRQATPMPGTVASDAPASATG